MAPKHSLQLPSVAGVTLEPLTVRVAVASELTGLSEAHIRTLIKTGDLKAVNIGRTSLVIYQSLKALVWQRGRGSLVQ